MILPLLNKIYQGDCLEIMKTWPDGFIDCCVTSPPYWGLRDYNTAKWDGGDPRCNHQEYLGGYGNKSKKQITSHGTQTYNYRDICKKCGSRRIDNQLGLEDTHFSYTQKIAEIFSEVKRVLKKEGTLWLNIADSYSSVGRGGGTEKQQSNKGSLVGRKKCPKGLKPKDLVGIPWMVAFALRDTGWYLRSDIIWQKPNPMPESVTDRPTKSHEHIFLLSKSKSYYYDAAAIAEKISAENMARYARVEKFGEEFDKLRHKHHSQVAGRVPNPQSPMEVLTRAAQNVVDKGTRNKRDVWSVPVQGYKFAHFATFPEKLIRDCILAGCPQGGIVFDPFMGSGTSAVVSKKLSCNFIGTELNPEYLKIANNRINKENRLF